MSVRIRRSRSASCPVWQAPRPGSGSVYVAPMGNVYHGDHSGLVIDPVDDPVSPAPRAEPVVEWRMFGPVTTVVADALSYLLSALGITAIRTSWLSTIEVVDTAEKGLTERMTDRLAPGSARRFSSRSILLVWVAAWLIICAVGAVWAIANPIGNSPDEPAQIARAASEVRGHPIGAPIPGQLAVYTKVWIPRTYALSLDSTGGFTGAHNCYHFMPEVSAQCERIVASDKQVAVYTYVGHYPLFYYAVVGLPSLFTTSIAGLYLMRLVSVALCAALLALALAVSWRWASSPLLIGAVAVVATPTAVFMASSVNPSGLEISAAICTWVAASVFVLDHLSMPPRGLLICLGTAASVLALTRPISTLWLLVVVVIVVLAAWRRVSVRVLLRRGDFLVTVTVVAVTSVASAVWVFAANGLAVRPEGPPPPGTPLSRLVSSAIDGMWGSLSQAAGTFGWGETHEPGLAVFFLLIAVSVPVVMCVARSSKQNACVTLLLMTLSALMPLALVVASVRRDGLEEQGRYFMPLWVGVPLFAAATQRALPSWAARRLSSTMVLPATGGLVLAFWWNLHRVAVGVQGPYLPWNLPAGAWRPPTSATVLDASAVVIFTAYAALLLALSDLRPRVTAYGSGRREEPPPNDPELQRLRR